MHGVRPIESCRVWVSGGRRGLGRAYAEHFASLGAEVHVTTRDPAREDATSFLEALEAKSRAWADGRGDAPRKMALHAWDMEDPESTKAIADVLRSHPAHVVVHAAHVFGPHVPIVALRPEQLVRSLEVNVGAAYAFLRAAARGMARERFGRILAIGSYASVVGGMGQAAYVAEKAALEGLVRVLASELGAKGVLANVVHPGIIDTENVRERVTAEVQAAYAKRTVLGRLLTADEVVHASFSLVDPRQAAVTGQSLRIAAGLDLASTFWQGGSEGA